MVQVGIDVVQVLVCPEVLDRKVVVWDVVQ